MFEHENIVKMLISQNDIKVFFVGEYFFKNMIVKSNLNFFKNFDDFSNDFERTKFEDSIILIKGSRGMALERTLELL
jgi:UDP-N-acetylmuramoyl-tripeptide--D-alanyl-D-alanine ligase